MQLFKKRGIEETWRDKVMHSFRSVLGGGSHLSLPGSDAPAVRSALLLAHIIRYDIDLTISINYIDEEMFEKIDSHIHFIELKQAFTFFKRNYRHWFSR